MQIKKQPKIYDVVIIGSGASGGMAAWNLTRQGVNVLMLDAGERFDPVNFWMALLPYEKHERLQQGERPYQFFLSRKEQPLLTPPDLPFNLYRVWGLGGKTNIWGRVSLRYSDVDFKVNDGYGIPWPFEYKDIKPYYDKVDQLIGVCGGDDDSDVLPGSQYHLPQLYGRETTHDSGIGGELVYLPRFNHRSSQFTVRSHCELRTAN